MKFYISILAVIFITQTWKKRVFSIAKFRKIKFRKLQRDRHVYTNKWVVYIKNGVDIVQQIAEEHNFIYHGQLGNLKDFYHLEHKRVTKHSYNTANDVHFQLANHPNVLWLKQQTLKKRVVRGYFSDPLFKKQWYIKDNGLSQDECKNMKSTQREDINIFPAWNSNLTGKGVVVSIIDDGIEYTHPDLRRNYDPKASFDYNDNDDDPFPRYTADNINKHGTRCAGEVAAEINNSVCGVGVAYNARLGGIRMLDGDVTDAVEASSFGHRSDYIDIYSVSWGPEDDGRTVDGPGPLAKRALELSIKNGRNKLGSIFVWATGNGGKYQDQCSCDGYVNSPYTISIGAVDMCGAKPWYAEDCPSTIAVTYSGKADGRIEISTTDLHGACTSEHTGSSAAAPLAAGIFALVLEANPKLSWRDMQHLIVKTTKVVSPDDKLWSVNGAGYKINPKFGFGLLDTGALVKAAVHKNWRTAPQQMTCVSKNMLVNLSLVPRDNVTTQHNSTGCSDAPNHITKLEHVTVIVTINQRDNRGKLGIILTSPAGTKSVLLKQRSRDTSTRGFREWEFLTVFHWGENPTGVWNLTISDDSLGHGKLVNWRLKLFGTPDLIPEPSKGTNIVPQNGIIISILLLLLFLWT